MKRYQQLKPVKEQSVKDTKPSNISKADKEKQAKTDYNQPIQDAIRKLKNEHQSYFLRSNVSRCGNRSPGGYGKSNIN